MGGGFEVVHEGKGLQPRLSRQLGVEAMVSPKVVAERVSRVKHVMTAVRRRAAWAVIQYGVTFPCPALWRHA